MTPDMKRLVEAAAKCSEMPVCLDEIYNPAASDNPADYEAIVRAVLTELREVSESMSAAGEKALEDAKWDDYGLDGDDIVSSVCIEFNAQNGIFAAMLNAVLAEPATP